MRRIMSWTWGGYDEEIPRDLSILHPLFASLLRHGHTDEESLYAETQLWMGREERGTNLTYDTRLLQSRFIRLGTCDSSPVIFRNRTLAWIRAERRAASGTIAQAIAWRLVGAAEQQKLKYTGPGHNHTGNFEWNT